MKVEHFLPSKLTRGPIRIAVIGAGGTGSSLLPRLMQLNFALRELEICEGLSVEVWDDDTVSPSNIGRQGFFSPDVGENKAMLLVNRLNMAWGTSWTANPRRLTGKHRLNAEIVIGCVDSRKARTEIMAAMGTDRTYWLDCGNSVDSGQVVLGQYEKNAIPSLDRLPCVADLFPDLVNPSLDEVDEEPSCSVADSIRKQSLVINSAMALEAFNLLWMFFNDGALTYSGRFVNLRTGYNQPIPLDTEVWRGMGYDVETEVKLKAA